MRASVGWCWLSLMLPLAAGGCGNAIASGQNNALNGADLVRMTDDMAAAIAGDAKVEAAIARSGSLRVVVEPVVNHMTAEILPAGPADAFTARVRTLLARHDPARFTWIMNREAFYRLRGQELEGVNVGPSPEAVNPEYALTATFTSIVHENGAGRNDYYVCSYSLTNLADRTVLWTKAYEVQKRAVGGLLD
jgi:hypothetical protein